MNKKIISLLGLIGSVALIALTEMGCATTGNHPPAVAVNPTNGIVAVFGHDINPQDVGNGLKIASQGAAMTALNYDKNSRAYLESVEVVLTSAIANGQYDPALLNQALDNISIKEAHDPNVSNGINGALALYGTFFGQVGTAKLSDASPYLLPALTGLRDGISAALAAVPPPVVVPKTPAASTPNPASTP